MTATQSKPRNPHRITLQQLAEREGVDVMEILEEATFDGVCPALCTEGCEVEPDGRCEHGCPSALIAAGFI